MRFQIHFVDGQSCQCLLSKVATASVCGPGGARPFEWRRGRPTGTQQTCVAYADSRNNLHRVAVNTLLRWHWEGRDVEAWLPCLTTYLGYVHLGDTYWYLTAGPEMLQLVARRMDRDAHSQVPA